MKLVSIFFKTSESIFAIYRKDTDKRVRNMKLVSIFFKTSESIFAIHRKDTDKRAKTNQVYLNMFLGE